MSFGEKLVFLRKMRNQMLQEELAEQMKVSRQTISKWEVDASYPEMSKVIELCKFFSCSMDDLILTDMNVYIAIIKKQLLPTGILLLVYPLAAA